MRPWRRWVDWYHASESLLAQWMRAAREALLGEMPVLAGGTALFAIFAVVPTLAAIVAIYSVVADPSEINRHLRGLETVLPPNVLGFVSDQLTRQTQRSTSDLGFALVVSILAAVWAARGAARALIDALNRAYRVRERRKSLHKLGLTIAMSATTLLGLLLMFSIVVALPAVFAMFGYRNWGLVRWLRWPALMGVIFGSLLLLYRFAPSPRTILHRHLWPGSLISTFLLVAMSWGLSIWVDRIADYNLWYGTFGSVVVVMLWFYLSTIAIVLGGFVNAELERHSGAPQPDRSMY
ncbi:MAG: YihY/virulence factor BrkB family protein [Kofleriaceae bacterium]